MPDYEVIRDGWVAGRMRQAGTTVTLTEAEAKHERNLRRIDPSKPAKATARKPRKEAPEG
ncbi:MAG: hypothetical protein AAFW69_04250 [Pseudomonadota bacterium]